MFPDQMGKLMQQAQKMQEKMQTKQAELDKMEFTGTAGGGMATAVVNGKMEVIKLNFMPEAVDPEDVDMLEDIILAAIQDAQAQAKQKADSELGSLTGGLKLPF